MTDLSSLRTPRSVQCFAVAVAVLVTAVQLRSVDSLAQHRTIAPHVQVVQLPRVVITGQRLVATPTPAAAATLARTEAAASGS